MPLNPLLYIAAVLYPGGRLPFLPFLVLGAMVGVGQAYLYRQCAALDDPWGTTIACLLLGIWVNFCLISRRLQDGGYANLPAFALMILTIFTFLGTLDISLLSATALESKQAWEARLDIAWYLYKGAYSVLFCLCLTAESEGGKNAYGAEFGHDKQVARRRAPLASEKVHRGTGR
jgi:uncharacterized membrane protein YhaH (DUF805 family)